MKEFVKNLTPPIIYAFARKLLTPRHSKIITGKIGDFNLLMNADHSIIGNIIRHQSYSANLPRLTQNVRGKYPDMVLIDVGANIGDGVALVRTKVYCPIVCIEGDVEYFNLLTKNLTQFKDTTAYNNFLGEQESGAPFHVIKQEGTLRIKKVDTSQVKTDTSVSKIITLDSLARAEQKKFTRAKLLKIDTDGYDLKIIRGAVGFIKQNKPVLFFEYDRVYLEAVGDDGLSIFNTLKELGYNTILFYDNYGRFLVSASLNQSEQIVQLAAYIIKRKGAFPYYDLCIFHKEDDDIAQSMVDAEILNNK